MFLLVFNFLLFTKYLYDEYSPMSRMGVNFAFELGISRLTFLPVWNLFFWCRSTFRELGIGERWDDGFFESCAIFFRFQEIATSWHHTVSPDTSRFGNEIG